MRSSANVNNPNPRRPNVDEAGPALAELRIKGVRSDRKGSGMNIISSS